MLPTTVSAFLSLLVLPITATSLADIRDAQSNRVVKRATPTLTGVVIATQKSGEYFGPVMIDGANHSVLYDTGSNVLWIKGPYVQGPPFSVSYGSGSVSGNITRGIVTIGGSTIANQTYGVATSWSSSFENLDGILGLGQSLTQLNGYSTWMANAMPQYKQQLYAVNMPPTGPATFTFGYHEAAHENGTLAYNPATSSSSLWLQQVTSFNIPANDTSMNCNLDTGTTDILIPSSVAYGFWNQVKNATGAGDDERWFFNCAESATVPDFSVTIGGTKYTIAAADTYFVDQPSPGLCGSRLQGTKSGCILGQPFFYSNYVAYDFGNKSVGLTGRK
ncbi:acid protease [Xylariaceae sp. AK1471]|nr:acid protease [Xylariaceae sp. AK1471]